MSYTKTDWSNTEAPPISAENLNKMELGIATGVGYATADEIRALPVPTAPNLKVVLYGPQGGVFIADPSDTITTEDGVNGSAGTVIVSAVGTRYHRVNTNEIMLDWYLTPTATASENTVAVQAAVSAAVSASKLLLGSTREITIDGEIHCADANRLLTDRHDVHIKMLNLKLEDTSGLLHYPIGDFIVENCNFTGDVEDRTILDYTLENPVPNGYGNYSIVPANNLHAIMNLGGSQVASKSEGVTEITDCTFTDIFGTGISVGTTKDVHIRRNTFLRMSKAFTWIWLSDDATAVAFIEDNYAEGGGLFPTKAMRVDGVPRTITDNYDVQSAFGFLTTGGALVCRRNTVIDSSSISLLHNFGKRGTDISDNYCKNDNIQLKSSNPPNAIWDEFCSGDFYNVKNNTIVLGERTLVGAAYSGFLWLSFDDVSKYTIAGNTIDILPAGVNKCTGISINAGSATSVDTEVEILQNQINGVAADRHGLVIYTSNVANKFAKLTLKSNIIDGEITYDYANKVYARDNTYTQKPSTTGSYSIGVGVDIIIGQTPLANNTDFTISSFTLDRGIYDVRSAFVCADAAISTPGDITYDLVISESNTALPSIAPANPDSLMSVFDTDRTSANTYKTSLRLNGVLRVDSDNTAFYFRCRTSGTAVGTFYYISSLLVTRSDVDY